LLFIEVERFFCISILWQREEHGRENWQRQ